MKNIKERFKEKFDYDVDNLPAYVNEQSDDIHTDLLYSSGLTSRIQVLEEVKGSETIKLLNADLALQTGSGCSVSEDGSIVFDGVNLTTKRLMVHTSLCNDDLNGTWAQMLNKIGANAQDRDMPIQDVITAYLVKLTKKKNQDLMFNGDTASLNPDLAHYDGFVKLWDADADLNEVGTNATEITSTNAFDIAKELYDGIPHILFDNDVNVEIICGRETAEKIINQVYNDKDYASSFNVNRDGSEISFVLPTTSITVRSYPQLSGTEKMYAVPYDYMFFGTDLTSDIDGVTVKYLEEAEKIRIRNLFRSGVQYVYPEYFTKLTLTAP